MARRFYSLIAASAIGTALLAGCDRHQMTLGQDATLSAYKTNADTRIVFDRPDPDKSSGKDGGGSSTQRIICVEPSPDIAKALSTALALSGSGTTPAGVTASASVNYSTAEAITALAGRTEAVVALRDGLFQVCQAYANGVIPKVAYALVLSQYDNLLVTLMLGEAASNAAQKSGGSGGGSGGGSTPANGGSGGSGGGGSATGSISVTVTPSSASSPGGSTTPPAAPSTAPASTAFTNLQKALAQLDKMLADPKSKPADIKTARGDVTKATSALGTALKKLQSASDQGSNGSQAGPKTSNPGDPIATMYQTFASDAPTRLVEALFVSCLIESWQAKTPGDNQGKSASNAGQGGNAGGTPAAPATSTGSTDDSGTIGNKYLDGACTKLGTDLTSMTDTVLSTALKPTGTGSSGQ